MTRVANLPGRWLKRLFVAGVARSSRRPKLSLSDIRARRPQRILIVRQHNQMGDMVCATPALRAVRLRLSRGADRPGHRAGQSRGRAAQPRPRSCPAVRPHGVAPSAAPAAIPVRSAPVPPRPRRGAQQRLLLGDERLDRRGFRRAGHHGGRQPSLRLGSEPSSLFARTAVTAGTRTATPFCTTWRRSKRWGSRPRGSHDRRGGARGAGGGRGVAGRSAGRRPAPRHPSRGRQAGEPLARGAFRGDRGPGRRGGGAGGRAAGARGRRDRRAVHGDAGGRGEGLGARTDPRGAPSAGRRLRRTVGVLRPVPLQRHGY